MRTTSIDKLSVSTTSVGKSFVRTSADIILSIRTTSVGKSSVRTSVGNHLSGQP